MKSFWVGWAIHGCPIMDTLGEGSYEWQLQCIHGYICIHEIIRVGWAIHGCPIMDTLGEGSYEWQLQCYPWVTMDTFVVHNTSPADSCKLDREGTLHGAVSRHSKRLQWSTLLGTGTRYMQHSHNLCSWHTLEHYCWNAVGKLKYHFYFQITQLHLSHFATISRDASNMPA